MKTRNAKKHYVWFHVAVGEKEILQLRKIIKKCLLKVCRNQLDKHYWLTARRLNQVITDSESKLLPKND